PHGLRLACASRVGSRRQGIRTPEQLDHVALEGTALRTSVSVLAALVGVLAVAAPRSSSAGNPATISVTVTIQNLSVSTSGPIAYGVVTAASQTVSSSGSTVTNDGNTAETFSLSLTNPSSWTAVQAAPSAAEEYALCAQFNSSAPTAG